jgi:Flp pilus assembly protein TadG
MLLSRFLKDRNGNIVPMFAAALIPVVGLVGAAVDYSRASAVRSEMQAGLDATALMLSKEASGLTTQQLQEKATAYFQAVFNRPEAKDVIITPTFTTKDGSSTIKVVSTGSVDTTFTRILGASRIDLGSSSEVTWGYKKLELALALDNTGSMESKNKMDELKKAAKSLLDTLKNAVKKDGDVKVAIIPFTTDVNIGKGYVDAAWLDWSAWEDENGHDESTVTCTKKGKKKKCTTSTAWVPDNHNTWKGCVRDRTYDHDVKDSSPNINDKATFFPASQGDPCPVQLQPLTSQWGQLVSTVESMKPDGMTNVTIGLVWAWHALTAGVPLTEASAPAADLDKVIILLTDGENTESWNNKDQDEVKNSADIDARTKKACDNVKAANITVYTVRVIEGNASLLQGCASKPEYYFDVQNASQLNTVFKQISDNLASLRISK